MSVDQKIAFIICANDEEILRESEHYIDSLFPYEDLAVDKIFVRDAASMASGYNKGMKQTDAKYKVYMHQDVFVLNRFLIRDLILLFRRHPELGIVGVVGAKEHIKSGNYLGAWDFGALSSMMPLKEGIRHSGGQDYEPAVALDGLFLATQYDVEWREDLFDGWDFYDISQCFEFTREGYKVGIVNQKPDEPWCHHDTEAMGLSRYLYYRTIMVKEYTDIYTYDTDFEKDIEINNCKRHKILDELDIAIHKIIDEEDNFDTAVGIIYDNRAMIGANRSLCNLKKIALISKKEKDNFGRYYFYRQGDTADMLINRLRGIRWAIKRLECLKDDSLMRAILSDPSISDVALANSAVFYVMRWDDFMQPLSKLLLEIEAPERFMTIQAMIQRELNDLFGGGKDGRF